MRYPKIKIIVVIFLAIAVSILFPPLTFARRVMDGNIWIPIEGLNGKIVVNKSTGRIKFGGEGSVVTTDFTFWAVRHGETFGMANKTMFQGGVDGPLNQLNAEGREQAEEAASILFEALEGKIRSGEKIVVITSQLRRTQDTAAAFINLVKRETGITIEPIVEPLANEICYGEFDGKTPEQLLHEHLILVTRYRERLDATVKYPGGESFIDLLMRAQELFNKLNSLYSGSTVILFSHNTLLNASRVILGDRSSLDASGQIVWRGKGKMFEPAQPVLLSGPDFIPSI